MLFFFLTSGLFLGWSLGANDAANVFGSAVGTKMVSFRKAAIIAGVFVIIGAVWQGAGASHTLGQLGKIDAIAGAFTVALAAALTVFYMTKFKLPVSTTQAIVGGIIGWNLYTGNPTDMQSLTKILITWVSGPVLGAIFSIILYYFLKLIITKTKPHLLKLDAFLRLALIVVGAFGSYSLGANNIANVMGVFVSSVSWPELDLIIFKLNSTQQLFFIGGVSIAVGVFTYSRKIMERVGSNIVHLSSEAALVVVLAQSMVLFIFSSQSLSDFFVQIGLPPIPLVPVSSSQAIVGSIIGIGILKGGREIKYKVLGEIAIGWVTTPIIAGLIAFFALFFVNNVFKLKVTEDSDLINPFSQKSSLIDSSTSGTNDTTIFTDAFENQKELIVIDNNDALQKTDSLNDNKSIVLDNQILIQDKKDIDFWKKISIFQALILLALIVWYFIFGNKRKENVNREIIKKREEFQKAEQELIEAELKNANLVKQNLQNELKLKSRELINLALHIIEKDNVFKKLKAKIDKIKNEKDSDRRKQLIIDLSNFVNTHLNTDKDKETFYLHVEKANRDFFTRLNKLHSDLTNNEKRLCALVRLNFSSKEIASILNISPKSVEMNRYRLRKKLNVPSSEKLNDFIAKI